MNYVMFCYDLSDIGGGQEYVLRKARHQKEKGNNVLLVTAKAKPLLLDGLSEFKIIEAPQIAAPYYLFGYNQTMKVVNQIIEFIKQSEIKDQVVFIESASINIGVWAEMVAERLKGVSLIYDLGGSVIKKRQLAEFASYKLQKKELIGCSEFLLPKLFSNFPEYLPDGSNDYLNIPFETGNETRDYSFSPKNNPFKNGQVNIFTISRIAKPYLFPLVQEIGVVASTKPEFSFVLTLVLDKREGAIFKTLKTHVPASLSNLRVEFVGPLVPLPDELFQTNNIFVGMGTAALNAISYGIPTIIQKFDSEMSAGILGLDVNYFGYSPTYEKPVSEHVIRLLEEKDLFSKASERGYELFKKSFDLVSVMDKFDSIIDVHLKKDRRDYFVPVSPTLSPKEAVIKILINAIGYKAFKKIFRRFNARKQGRK